MKTFKIKSGLELPLLNLKGKDYLMIAHRLQWLSAEYPKYDLITEMVREEDQTAIFRATITLYNTDGSIVRKATATKRETFKDFPDYIEKAETGAIGRALALIGIGTQFAQQDLDEGSRLADSPLAAPSKTSSPKSELLVGASTGTANLVDVAVVTETPAKRTSSFRRKTADTPVSKTDNSTGWS